MLNFIKKEGNKLYCRSHKFDKLRHFCFGFLTSEERGDNCWVSQSSKSRFDTHREEKEVFPNLPLGFCSIYVQQKHGGLQATVKLFLLFFMINCLMLTTGINERLSIFLTILVHVYFFYFLRQSWDQPIVVRVVAVLCILWS